MVVERVSNVQCLFIRT